MLRRNCGVAQAGSSLAQQCTKIQILISWLKYTAKIFNGTPDNFSYVIMLIPHPIDKTYILLDNEAVSQFLLLCLLSKQSIWSKIILAKTIAAQAYGSNLFRISDSLNEGLLIQMAR